MICASHSEKYKTLASCSKVLAEGGHTADDEKAYRSDVDLSQRSRNVIVFDRQYALERMREAEKANEGTTGRKTRKDAVRMFSTVTSFPKSWPDWAVKALAEELYNAHTRVLEKAGMDVSYRLGYAIHYDEHSPHMHEFDCPMKFDGRLSCKTILSKKTLTQLHKAEWDTYKAFADRHPELEKMASYTHGSERQHLGTQAYKADKLRQEINSLEEKKQVAIDEIDTLEATKKHVERENKETTETYTRAVKNAETALNGLTADIKQTQEEYVALKSDIDDAYNGLTYAFNTAKKTFGGKVKVVLDDSDRYAISWALEHANLATGASRVIDKLTSKVTQLLDGVKGLYMRAEQAKQEAEQARDEAEQIVSGRAYDKALKEVEFERTRARNLRKDNTDLRRKRDDLQYDVDALQARKDALQSELQANGLARLSHWLNELRRHGKRGKRAYDECTQQLSDYTDQIRDEVKAYAREERSHDWER